MKEVTRLFNCERRIVALCELIVDTVHVIITSRFFIFFICDTFVKEGCIAAFVCEENYVRD